MNFQRYKTVLFLLQVVGSVMLCGLVSAQAIVRMVPPFPSAEDSVLLYLDASQSGLAGETGNIYAHTGLTINGNNWRNVVGNWGANDGKGQMQRLAADQYLLKIAPSVREWYDSNSGQSIASNADLSKIDIIFRNADGSKKAGEGATDADIFLDLFMGQFLAAITSHTQKNLLLFEGEQVTFTGQSSTKALLSFGVDGVEVVSGSDTARIDFSILTDTLSAGLHTLVFSASDGDTTIRDSVLLNRHGSPVIESVPEGRSEGITYPDAHSVYLQLRAPGKEFVYVLGDFNDWTILPEYQMKKTPDGTFFWIEIPGLDSSIEYRFQYYINREGLQLADPYCEKILDPWNDKYITNSTYPDLIAYPVGKANGIAGVLKTLPDSYTWDDSYTYNRPPREDLVIYELHIRDFTTERTFNAVIDRLDYLSSLGINALELMPLAEFEGNDSWGYNPIFFSAVDKAYGPATDFKRLVDSCHSRGIAVLVDVVYNHAFGQCPLAQLYFANGKPTAENPWLNTDAKHNFNVGYDFNHESEATHYFVGKTLRHWIKEYRIDGYRFDLSKGFTQKNTLGNVAAWGAYDQSRINILDGYADSVRKEDPSSILILEHFADWSEEKVLAQYGFILWAKGTDQYNQNTMGYSSNSNLYDLTINKRGWQSGIGPERYGIVSFMESHDEERLMAKNISFGNRSGDYNTKDLTTALQRMAMAACFFIPLPSAKMIWQFGELGYDLSINYCSNGTISNNCRTGAKPVRWNYYADQDRRKLFDVYRKLNYLKRTFVVFRDLNVHMELGGYKKVLRYSSQELDVVIAGNFNVTGEQMIPGFPYAGKWYDYLSGDSITITDPSAARNFVPGEYHVYLNKRVMVPENTYMPTVSIEDQVEEKIEPQVFPNPFQEEVYLRIPCKTQIRKAVISFFDLSGKMVNSGIYFPDETGTVIIGTGQLPSGAYIYKITSDGGLQFNGKLIKQ